MLGKRIGPVREAFKGLARGFEQGLKTCRKRSVYIVGPSESVAGASSAKNGLALAAGRRNYGLSLQLPVVQLPSGVQVVQTDPSEIVNLSLSVATVAFDGSPPPEVNAP